MKKFGKEDYGNGVKYWYLFGKKIAKKCGNCFYLLGKKDEEHYDGREWYVGWKDWTFGIYYNVCGYEEGNGELHISMFGWHSVFKFPWKSRRFPDGDCDAPQYGIAIHNSTFWLYKGGDGNLDGGSKWWTWDLPFFTWIHIRHDVECNIGDSEDECPCLVSYDTLMHFSDGQKYVPLEKNPRVYKYRYGYKDSYDGKIIGCTFWVEEREWRRKWFTWIDSWKRVNRYIEIVFDEEVGKEKGSC